MFKKLKPLICFILFGIVASISMKAASRDAHVGAYRNVTPDFTYVFKQRTYEDTGDSRFSLNLSMASNPSSRHYNYDNYAPQSMAVSRIYAQEQLQACKQAYESVPTERQVDVLAFGYQTKVDSLSLVQLNASNVKLKQEIAVWQNKLYPLLNLQRDFEATEAFSYMPGQEGDFREVPLRLASQVCLCLQNETAIQSVNAEIGYRENCLGINQQRIQELSARLRPAKVDVVVSAPEKAYTVVAQEIPKIQASLEQRVNLAQTAQVELRAARRTLSDGLIKIADLDHWYHPFSGSEIAKLRGQNSQLRLQIDALEEAVGKLNNSQELDKNELIRLEAVVTNGRRCVEECTHLQKFYQPVNEITTDPVDKQRCTALAETVNSKNTQSVIVIELSHDAQAALKLCGIDIGKIAKKFNGNAFQKQLSSEICNILDRSGKTIFSSKDVVVRAYAEATVHTCEVAIEQVHKGTSRYALMWTNLAHFCERATQIAQGLVRGTARGVIEGYTGMAHAVCHPVEFVKQCGTLLRLGLKFNGISIDENWHVSLADNRVENAIKLTRKMEAMYNNFARLPLDQQTEQVTSMIVSFVLPMPSAKMAAHFGKPFAYLHKAIKIEAAALRSSSSMAKVPSVGAALVEGVHLAMEPLVGSKAKVAESITSAMSQSMHGTRALASMAVSASHLESASARASNVLESETKIAASTAATQQITQTATKAAASVTSSAAESVSSAVQESGMAVTAKAQASAATAAATVVASSSQMATRIFKERKVMPEEAARMMQPKKVARVVLSEAEVKAILNAAKVAPNGFKNTVITKGDRIREIVHLPVEAPTNKGLYHHIVRLRKNGIGRISGAHVPAKYPLYPQLTSRLKSGPNAFGVRKVELVMEGARDTVKTVGPDSWKQSDYANHLKEAYKNIIDTECLRDGALRIECVEQNGRHWEMILELEQGTYQLTTGYPTLCKRS